MVLEAASQKLTLEQELSWNNLSSPTLAAGGVVTAIPAAFRRVNMEINYQSVNAGGMKTQQVKEKCSSEKRINNIFLENYPSGWKRTPKDMTEGHWLPGRKIVMELEKPLLSAWFRIPTLPYLGLRQLDWLQTRPRTWFDNRAVPVGSSPVPSEIAASLRRWRLARLWKHFHLAQANRAETSQRCSVPTTLS